MRSKPAIPTCRHTRNVEGLGILLWPYLRPVISSFHVIVSQFWSVLPHLLDFVSYPFLFGASHDSLFEGREEKRAKKKKKREDR